MASGDILEQYRDMLKGNTKKPLNEGLLNLPDVNYKGLDEYPYSGSFAWIDNEWKLHQEGDEFLLYNLAKDREEEIDLADMFPDKVNTMKKALRKWQESVIKSLRGEDY